MFCTMVQTASMAVGRQPPEQYIHHLLLLKVQPIALREGTTIFCYSTDVRYLLSGYGSDLVVHK